MKNLSFSSLCKRAVTLLVLAVGLCASAKAETSSWTTSYFERELAVPDNDEWRPSTMAPMFLMGDYLYHDIYVAIRAYSPTYFGMPLHITFLLGPGTGVFSMKGEMTVFNVKEENAISWLCNQNGNIWIRLQPIPGVVLKENSIYIATVEFRVKYTNDQEDLDYYKNAMFELDTSLREALEEANLLSPLGLYLAKSYSFE